MIGIEMARAAALGASCSQQPEAGGEGILRYINTAQVVEDMVEIIEREGEWRADEATRLTILAEQRASSSVKKRQNGEFHLQSPCDDFVRCGGAQKHTYSEPVP